MEIFKIIAMGIVTTIAVLVVKPTKPEIALLIGLAGSVLIFINLIDMLASVFNVFTLLVEKTGVSSELFASLLKIIGVGYLAEFSASICADSGNGSIAEKILFGGKIVILMLALPIFISILDIIMGLL